MVPTANVTPRADAQIAAAAVSPAKKRGRPILTSAEKEARRAAQVREGVARFSGMPDSSYVRQPVPLALLGISAATWWRWVKQHPELAPTKLSERVTAWTVGQLRAFMQTRAVAA